MTDIDLKRLSMSDSPNVLPTKSLQQKHKCLVLHTSAAKKFKFYICNLYDKNLKM